MNESSKPKTMAGELEATLIELCNVVYQTLGPGLSESVYQQAVLVELRKRAIKYDAERVLSVFYDSHFVGTLRPDVVLNGWIVEFKAAHTGLKREHQQQLQAYMRILKSHNGLLINFNQSTGAVESIVLKQNAQQQEAEQAHGDL